MKGKLRIIAGRWRGHKLLVPDRPGLRPTGDRARETLFNWLGPRIIGARVLDLFAGTGALGLEAASRGASRVVMVEQDRVAVESLRAGPLTWPGAEGVEVVHADALSWLAGADGPFDLVLLDPPFDSGLLQPALTAVLARPGLLVAGAELYVETAANEPTVDGAGALELVRHKRQGQVVLNLLRWQGERNSGL